MQVQLDKKNQKPAALDTQSKAKLILKFRLTEFV